MHLRDKRAEYHWQMMEELAGRFGDIPIRWQRQYPFCEKLSLNAQFSAATKRWNDEDALIDLGLGARFKPQEQVFLAGAAYKCLTDNYDYGFQVSGGYEF